MHKKIDEVLKTIDVARPAASDTEIKIFTLVNAEPLPAANMLCDLLPKETHVAVDHRTRSVVVSGPRDALEIAAAVLQRLDAGGKGERPKLPANYEVQVEWFANDGKGAAPAADLKDVVAELARLGIKDPRQIGRLTVQTSSAHSFRLVSSPVFAGRRAKLTASGILSATNEAAVTMEIAINATEVGYTATGQVEHNLSEISTRIAMPQGQYVVLATAPVTTSAGDITSVFVVRVSARPAPGIRQ
jgi:type II secretory pathway component GspD/PulD (secretin)